MASARIFQIAGPDQKGGGAGAGVACRRMLQIENRGVRQQQLRRPATAFAVLEIASELIGRHGPGSIPRRHVSHGQGIAQVQALQRVGPFSNPGRAAAAS